MKYYVIKIIYVGPDDLGDVDTIGIYRIPARDWWDKLPVIYGRTGARGNWVTFGHGAYATIDEARARIDELYPERREVDEYEYEDYWDDIVELYNLGKYAQLTRMDTRNWLWGEDLSLTGNETDDELREIIEMAELSANDDGCTLHDSAFDILEEEREWRRKEVSE